MPDRMTPIKPHFIYKIHPKLTPIPAEPIAGPPAVEPQPAPDAPSLTKA